MTGPEREGLSRCALSATLQTVGDRWSILILQAVSDGNHHYEGLHAELGIARNVLADRLVRLVRSGILTREGLPENRRKIRYALTPKGEALLPVMLALRRWGEAWETGPMKVGCSPQQGWKQPANLRPDQAGQQTLNERLVSGSAEAEWNGRD